MENDEIRDEVTLEEEPQTEEVVEAEGEETTQEAEETSEEPEKVEKDWEAEAKKWQAIAQRNKNKKVEKPAKLAEKGDDELVSRLANLELAERKRQFGYEHGLSPKETDAVFKIDNNPTDKTLKDPFIKAGLQALRAQDRVANNTPSSSTKSGTLSPKKLSKMSPEEKQEAFQQHMKAKGVLN